MTHDYKRHGTVDLFAALNVGTGEVIYGTRNKPHPIKGCPCLLQADRPRRPESRPRHPRGVGQPERPQRRARRDELGSLIRNVRAGICTSRRHRASWLNLIERWFKELTDPEAPSWCVLERQGTSHRGDRALGSSLERRPPSRSSGTSRLRRSSPESDEDDRPLPKSNPARATNWHNTELLASDVTVNISKASDTLVKNSLFPTSETYIDIPIRQYASVAKRHHLSLFAHESRS